MYIDELIEELEKWKSKTAEVTINGTPIDRVTCGNGENVIIVPKWEISIDERIDELEDEVEDLKRELNDAECDIEADDAHISDLEDLLNETLDYLDGEEASELRGKIRKVLHHWEY